MGVSAISSKKNVPPSASSKRPLRALTAPVNDPLAWPKSSLSSSVSVMAAQLTGTNGPLGALAVGVDGLGDELLAGAALARDEHDGVGRRDAHDAPEHLAHGPRSADDVLELVAILELAREERHLAGEAPVVERLGDLDEELLLGERLLDVVEGAEAHRLDGALDRAVRRHHDDLRQRVSVLGRPQDVDAVLGAHAQVSRARRRRRPWRPRSAPCSPSAASSTS